MPSNALLQLNKELDDLHAQRKDLMSKIENLDKNISSAHGLDYFSKNELKSDSDKALDVLLNKQRQAQLYAQSRENNPDLYKSRDERERRNQLIEERRKSMIGGSV